MKKSPTDTPSPTKLSQQFPRAGKGGHLDPVLCTPTIGSHLLEAGEDETIEARQTDRAVAGLRRNQALAAIANRSRHPVLLSMMVVARTIVDDRTIALIEAPVGDRSVGQDRVGKVPVDDWRRRRRGNVDAVEAGSDAIRRHGKIVDRHFIDDSVEPWLRSGSTSTDEDGMVGVGHARGTGLISRGRFRSINVEHKGARGGVPSGDHVVHSLVRETLGRTNRCCATLGLDCGPDNPSCAGFYEEMAIPQLTCLAVAHQINELTARRSGTELHPKVQARSSVALGKARADHLPIPRKEDRAVRIRGNQGFRPKDCVPARSGIPPVAADVSGLGSVQLVEPPIGQGIVKEHLFFVVGGRGRLLRSRLRSEQRCAAGSAENRRGPLHRS